MLNDGVYGNSIFPPLLCKKVVVPTASVLTLFTTPYTLITGQPGKIILPDKTFVTKQAGTAYNINGASLVFSWNGTTSWAGPWGAAALIGFMDTANKASVLSYKTFLASGSSTVVPSPTIVGQSLTVHNTVANFLTGTGELIFWITFRVWEFSQVGWL